MIQIVAAIILVILAIIQTYYSRESVRILKESYQYISEEVPRFFDVSPWISIIIVIIAVYALASFATRSKK
jgi:amino acid transporter